MSKLRILSSEYGSFRSDTLEYFKRRALGQASVILDPMAGTAPLIPFVEGNDHTAYFNDVLPVHFFINRAKTRDVCEHYLQHRPHWHVQRLLDCMAPLKERKLVMSDKWIDDTILDDLVRAWHATEEYAEETATILKAVILLCVRPFSSASKSKNPTWMKKGGISSGHNLEAIIKEMLSKFDQYYRHHYMSSKVKTKSQCVIMNQNAAELQLPEEADIILTSPPYCNRLDPIRQYGPETYFLSNLGYTSPESVLVSTPKVRFYHEFEDDLAFLTANSENAYRLLTKMQASSQACERGYYLKYYAHYFRMLFKVVARSLKYLSKNGKMYIVTQDNIHKGQLIEIDKILKDLLRRDGWRFRLLRSWERHHMGLRNVSRDHAFVRPKHFERLTVVWR